MLKRNKNSLKILSIIVLAIGILGLLALTYRSDGTSQDPPQGTPTELATNASVNIVEETDTAKPGIDANREVTSPDNTQSPSANPSPTSPYQDRVENEQIVADDGTTAPLVSYSLLALPNDPAANQWWVSPLGLDSFWQAPTSGSTLLAIIDTGFALDHQEFSGRWLVRPSESGVAALEAPSLFNCTDRALAIDKSCNLIDENLDGIVDNEAGAATAQNPSLLNCTDRFLVLDKSCNRIDDDGNGYIDDVSGWDFTTHYPSVLPGRSNSSGAGIRHGTQVAGVAAATGNNGLGVAGVDWQTKLLPLQAMTDEGSGNTLGIARAIRYAADNQADVINLSLGSLSPDSYMRDAINYAISKGSIVVAASGNDGCNCISYPARYDEVLSVGAIDQSDIPTSFSSYGTALDIMAPGIGMASTSWSAANGSSLYSTNIAGTSFASPFVAGTLTRLKSASPAITNAQLIALVTEQSSRLSLPMTTPKSSTLGFGRIHPASAWSRLQAPLAPILRTQFGSISSGLALGTFDTTRGADIYQCESPLPGTTPIYRLTKTPGELYTSSEAERYRAAQLGWSVTLVTYGCLGMPGDAPISTRQLSTQREFNNSFVNKF